MRGFFFVIFLLPLLGACAVAPMGKNAPMVQGPAIQSEPNPFGPALACVRDHLTLQDRQTSFGVAEFPDRTGKFSISSDTATGEYSTQGAQDVLTNALRDTGVTVVDTSVPVRSLIDWYGQKASNNLVGDGQERELTNPNGSSKKIKYIPFVQGTIMPPDLVVTGSIDGLDFMPGGGAQLSVAGIGGGYRQYRIHVSMNGRVVQMPVGTQVGGQVIASQDITKQVVADEIEADVARFGGFGAGPSTFITFDIGQQRREALEYVEGVMAKFMAVKLVTQALNIHDCDAALEKTGGD